MTPPARDSSSGEGTRKPAPVAKAKEAGGLGFLEKRFDAEELPTLVRSATGEPPPPTK